VVFGLVSGLPLAVRLILALIWIWFREFYRQTCSPKARKAYPKYETTLVLDEGLQKPFVKVAFGTVGPRVWCVGGN
jgi:hypothetical protein